MLVASIAVHLGVGLFVFAHFSGFSFSSSPPSPTTPPALLLIAPQRILTSQPIAPARTARISDSVSHSALPLLPAAASHPVSTSSGSPDLAFETHSHPQLRAPAWESILSPPMAPHLDGSAGTVFVLDISGSMYEPLAGSTRLARARQVLATQLRALPDGTPFAVTVYAETSRNSGPLVAASDATREAAVRLINQDFDCGGGTNLPDGLACAEELHPGRLVLVTDGDLNAPPRALLTDVAKLLQQDGSPAVTVIAIQPRSAVGDDSLLQQLASEAGGTYVDDAGKQLMSAATLPASAR